jgi:hypothetical protein
MQSIINSPPFPSKLKLILIFVQHDRKSLPSQTNDPSQVFFGLPSELPRMEKKELLAIEPQTAHLVWARWGCSLEEARV